MSLPLFFLKIQQRYMGGQKHRMHLAHVLPQIRITSEDAPTQKTLEFVMFLFDVRIQIGGLLEGLQAMLTVRNGEQQQKINN